MSTDLKITALSITNGDLEKAKTIYAWLADGAGEPANNPTSTKPKATKKDKPETAGEKIDAALEEEKPKAEKSAALDYARDVQPEVLKAVAVSKENTLAIIQSYGVAHAKAVPPEKFPELVKRCQDLVTSASNG